MAAGPSLIEIGFLVAGELDADQLTAVRAAKDGFVTRMRNALPEFDWRVALIRRPSIAQSATVQPVVLLEAAATERDARRWDFVVLITDAELVSYYVPYALGMPSRALGAAVISTSHLEPAEDDTQRDALTILTARLERLALHLIGHLNGLDHSEGESTLMTPVRVASELDGLAEFSPDELEILRRELRDVADLRLEEQPEAKGRGPASFHLQALWHNRDDIWSALRQLAPWRFPLRFSKLTIAAASTLIIFCITAESWQLGMAQPVPRVIAVSVASLLVSSLFILKRQRLLGRRGRVRLSEQTAVANLSVIATVFMGMLTTYALLFVLVFGFSQAVFTPEIVQQWAAFENEPPISRYLAFSGFVAAMGILAGGLGASFEAESYFRHVAYVDEES